MFLGGASLFVCGSSSVALLSILASLVVGHQSEVVEDLLEGGLGDGILRDVEILLDVFHHTEEETNRVITANLDLPGISILFNYLKLLELVLQMITSSLTLTFDKLPSDKLKRWNALSLSEKGIPLTTKAVL